MTTYILVHGAFVGGGWSWDKVQSLLEAQGHTAIALDLPGNGNDSTPLKDVTLQSYVDRVVQMINEQSQLVILVGHSLGGISISQAHEVVADKISKLVYVSAYLLQNGESAFSKSQEPEHASAKISLWGQFTEEAMSINPEGLKEVFCADCADADIERLKTRSQPQPLTPVGTPLSINVDPNAYADKRFYIETLQDQCVPNAIQRKMYTAMPCKKVMAMNTSHSPFFADPGKLVSYLTLLDKSA
jgi:pimeloyl-ACP methyl ester carboxylesterase